MKRHLLFLVSGIWLLVSSAFAIIDTNENGLSDLWEKAHNNNELFPATYDPEADSDQDGWTNAEEAAAGTDPADPNPPDGLVRPDTYHSPATYYDPDEDGIPDILTPETITLEWPTIPGKKYTLLVSADLAPGSWLPCGQDSTFIGNGNDVTYGFPTGVSARSFWRIAVTDTDSDDDGLTDAEETELGLDPNNAYSDSDSDGIPDSWEILNGLDPFDANDALLDPDQDGLSNAQEYNEGKNPAVHDVITSIECDWEAVGSGVTQRTYTEGTVEWEGTWSDGTAASEHMAHEEFQHVLAQRNQKSYNDEWITCGESNGGSTENGIMWPHPDKMQNTNGSQDVTLSEPGLITRMTNHSAGKYRVRLARNITTGPKVTERFIVMIYSQPGMTVTPTTSPLELTIEENQQYSQTIEVKSDLPYALIGLVKVKITAVFGMSAEPVGPISSRQILETYLGTIEVGKSGDTWLVKPGTTYFGVEISANKEQFIKALRSPDMTVIFDGHANFGLGPNFSTKTTHKTLADFTRIGSGKTSIPINYRGDGGESDVIQFTNGDGTELPENSQDLAAIDRIYSEGWAYLTVPSDKIIVNPSNYVIQSLGIQRFANIDGKTPGSVFPLQGSGVYGQWHFRDAKEGGKRIVVKTSGADLPTPAYKTFFYNACNSGRDYIESFKYGNFVYTKDTCRVENATTIFVQGILGKKPLRNIMEDLNIPGVGNIPNSGQSPFIYDYKEF